MNLYTVLPDLDAADFANVLPSLERAGVSVADLLSLEAVDCARRAQIPIREVRRLTEAVAAEFRAQYVRGDSNASHERRDAATALNYGRTSTLEGLESRWRTVSTLDDALDAALGGGFPTGYLTEITGESGVGKTQLALTLLLAVQLPPPCGSSRSALYVSTEAPLSTLRLRQIIDNHPRLACLAKSEKPSLTAVRTIQTPDLETQEHILRFQVPVAIQRYNVGILVIDSITANFRAEFDRGAINSIGRRTDSAGMARRSTQLAETGRLLRDIARALDVAVVVINQVADRFDPRGERDEFGDARRALRARALENEVGDGGGRSGSSQPNPELHKDDYLQHHSQLDRPSSTYPPPPPHPPSTSRLESQVEELTPTPPPPPPPSTAVVASASDFMTLDCQQAFFTGWGGEAPPASVSVSALGRQNLKTPSLGLVWTNQLAARVALTRDSWRGWRPPQLRHRNFKVVFAPWAPPSGPPRGAVPFEVWAGGVRGVVDEDDDHHDNKKADIAALLSGGHDMTNDEWAGRGT